MYRVPLDFQNRNLNLHKIFWTREKEKITPKSFYQTSTILTSKADKMLKVTHLSHL